MTERRGAGGAAGKAWSCAETDALGNANTANGMCVEPTYVEPGVGQVWSRNGMFGGMVHPETPLTVRRGQRGWEFRIGPQGNVLH